MSKGFGLSSINHLFDLEKCGFKKKAALAQKENPRNVM